MRRLVFATVMLLMFTGIIFGQSTPLTVEECIQIALRDNSTIRINRNLNESTSEDVTGSYAGILPTINISASTGKAKAGDRETEQDVPIGVRPDSSYIYGRRVITQPGYETNFNNFGLSVSQNVFDGGEWWNAISYAKSEKNVSDKTLHSTVSNVVLDVEQKFYDLLKAQKLLEVNELAVQRSEDQLNKTQKMFELGAVAKVDVFRSKVNLGNDRINQSVAKKCRGRRETKS